MTKALKLLDELATMEPDEIAVLFYLEGITGKSSITACPLVNYIKKHTALNCYVHPSYISIPRKWFTRVQHTLPGSVKEFVHQFDADKYPLLQNESPKVLSPIEF